MAIGCAALALVVGLLAVRLASAPYGHRVSALVHMSTADGVAPAALAADPAFAFVPSGSHYDGTYFYAVAVDPLALGSAHSRIDDGAYRYGHAGLGLLAFLLSLGRARGVPLALVLINLTALATAAWAGSRLAHELGRTPWAGLFVVLAPGLLYATVNDTSEPLSAALLGLGLLAWQRGQRRLAGLLFLPMCLTKEPLVLVPAAIGAWELIRIVRARERRRGWPDLALLAAGPALFVGWLGYLDVRFGQSPLASGQSRLSRPLHGYLDSLRIAASMVTGDTVTSQVGAAALPLLLVTAGALLVGVVVALRIRTSVDLAYLVTTAVALSVSLIAVLYPKDLMRITVIPVLLLPAVLATRRGDAAPPPDSVTQQ